MPDAAARLAASLAGAVADSRVLDALRSVPRERFVPPSLHQFAYDNSALPIACDQTISQPLVVARMLELLELEGDELVLDVGTGSGYHAALLARLAARVLSVERHAELTQAAQGVLTELGLRNVELFVGDGSAGLPGRAPFDAINVAAAVGTAVPPALLAQLAPGGRLVAPITPDPARPEQQWLLLVRSDRGRLRARRYEPVRFVPLVPGVAQKAPPGQAGGA